MAGLIPGSSPGTKGPAMTFLEFYRLSPTLSSLRSDIPPHKGEGDSPPHPDSLPRGERETESASGIPSKEGVTLARHASLLGSQFEIDDTLGRSQSDVTCTAPGSSRFKALGASPPSPCRAPVKELSMPTIRISRRSSVLRPASARYVPRSAIHVARSIPPREAKGSLHGCAVCPLRPVRQPCRGTPSAAH